MFKRGRSLGMLYTDLVKKVILNWDLISKWFFFRKVQLGTKETAKENISKGIIGVTIQSWGSEKYIQQIMANYLMNTGFTHKRVLG